MLRRRRSDCAREVPRLRRCIDQTLFVAYISARWYPRCRGQTL